MQGIPHIPLYIYNISLCQNPFFNFSWTSCFAHCPFEIRGTKGNGITCSIEYCSLRSNITIDRVNVLLVTGDTLMKNCNIIDNSHTTSLHGLIVADCPTLIQHCAFYQNDETHRWFDGRDGTIILTDSSFDSLQVSKLSGNIITNFIQPFEGTSFINALKHTVKEGLCEASYDVVGDLTPVFSDFVVCETNNVDIDMKTIDTMRVLEYVFVILLLGPWDYASVR